MHPPRRWTGPVGHLSIIMLCGSVGYVWPMHTRIMGRRGGGRGHCEPFPPNPQLLKISDLYAVFETIMGVNHGMVVVCPPPLISVLVFVLYPHPHPRSFASFDALRIGLPIHGSSWKQIYTYNLDIQCVLKKKVIHIKRPIVLMSIDLNIFVWHYK